MKRSSSVSLRSNIRSRRFMLMELKKLKGLLGVAEDDNSQDAPLQFVLDTVEETVLNYCNLSELPDGLRNTCYRMAIDLYRYEKPSDAGVPIRVASITEGDTATSFGVLCDVLKGTVLKDYVRQLNRYRRINHD